VAASLAASVPKSAVSVGPPLSPAPTEAAPDCVEDTLAASLPISAVSVGPPLSPAPTEAAPD
jgi:hypothetical protein